MDYWWGRKGMDYRLLWLVGVLEMKDKVIDELMDYFWLLKAVKSGVPGGVITGVVQGSTRKQLLIFLLPFIIPLISPIPITLIPSFLITPITPITIIPTPRNN